MTAIGATSVDGLYSYSDRHTQEEVLAVFDKAIDLASRDVLIRFEELKRNTP